MATQPVNTSKAVPASIYTPKSFDSEKYSIENLQYPSDLTSDKANEYGNNYVIFYINANQDSKMIKNQDANLTVNIDSSERVVGNLDGQTFTNAQAMGAGALAGGVAGAGVGGVGSLFGGGGAGLKNTLKAAGVGAFLGGGSAGIVGAVNTKFNVDESKTASENIADNAEKAKNTKFSKTMKRLRAAIALYVPNQLSIRYGAGWSEEETFMFSAGAAGARAMESSDKAVSDKEGLARTGGNIAANIALSTGPLAAGLSKVSGLAANPMKEQIFKGMDFRTFSVEYQFAPRDAGEASNVIEIIKAFKYHMHPEYKDSNNFLFIYPSEFDLVYYHNGSENMNIHRHTSCVLTEMNVNYTPNGIFSTFENGMPTQINIQMTFKELGILTKDLIAQGL